MFALKFLVSLLVCSWAAHRGTTKDPNDEKWATCSWCGYKFRIQGTEVRNGKFSCYYGK